MTPPTVSVTALKDDTPLLNITYYITVCGIIVLTYPTQVLVSADPSTRDITYDVLNSVDLATASISVG